MWRIVGGKRSVRCGHVYQCTGFTLGAWEGKMRSENHGAAEVICAPKKGAGIAQCAPNTAGMWQGVPGESNRTTGQWVIIASHLTFWENGMTYTTLIFFFALEKKNVMKCGEPFTYFSLTKSNMLNDRMALLNLGWMRFWIIIQRPKEEWGQHAKKWPGSRLLKSRLLEIQLCNPKMYHLKYFKKKTRFMR